ncbi:MAG: hypothetical protein IJN28_05425 [Selenomonadales bacterium]|nr:hypothetical protein [Selenomonadales bacterium]
MAFENGAGVVPVMDINNRGYNDGFGWGGGGCMWFLVLFALLGGGGFGGWGNNGMAAFANGALTRNDLFDGFNSQDIKNGIRGVQNGLADGFYAQNTTMLQGFNGLGRDVLENRFALGSAIAENRFAAQQCCCETNRNIDAVRFENAQNTCTITNNATANTQKILDKLCLMESNAKDQRIAQLQFDLQAAQLQIGNIRQTENIVNTVRPPVVPAYVVSSPYESIRHNYGYGGCGYGCGVAA